MGGVNHVIPIINILSSSMKTNESSSEDTLKLTKQTQVKLIFVPFFFLEEWMKLKPTIKRNGSRIRRWQADKYLAVILEEKLTWRPQK